MVGFWYAEEPIFPILSLLVALSRGGGGDCVFRSLRWGGSGGVVGSRRELF